MGGTGGKLIRYLKHARWSPGSLVEISERKLQVLHIKLYAIVVLVFQVQSTLCKPCEDDATMEARLGCN